MVFLLVDTWVVDVLPLIRFFDFFKINFFVNRIQPPIHNRCSRGCSINTFVIYLFINSVILSFRIFKALCIPNRWGAEILREWSTPHDVSHVMCHMSGVQCHFFLIDGASRWRVCYQRGLPRLVNNRSLWT